MPRNAFVDPVTMVLKSHGYVLTNESGDLIINVPEDFTLEPGKWKWDGMQFTPFTPPPPPDKFASAKAKVAAIPAGPIREAFDELLKVL